MGPLLLGWDQTKVSDGRKGGRPYSPSRISGQVNFIAMRAHKERVDVPLHCLPLGSCSTLQSGCSSQKKNPVSCYHFWLHRRRIHKGFSVQKYFEPAFGSDNPGMNRGLKYIFWSLVYVGVYFSILSDFLLFA